MLMRSEHDGDRIDAAIDAAARALTSSEPSTALREGVRNRIGRRWNVWRLVPAAAAAMIVVALILSRLTSAPETPVPPRPQQPELVVAPIAVPEPPPGIQRVVATTTMPPMRRLVAASEPPPEELEPVIPPITIAPLETALIAVDTSSGVMPIEIEPLRIEPLQGE
jgi:hypothetical protein